MRLVWSNGSFGCQTIAARTRDLIVHLLPAVISNYRSYVSVFEKFHRFMGNYYQSSGILGSCEDPDPSVGLRRTPPPQQLSWVPAAMLGSNGAPPWFALSRGMKR